MRLFLSHPKLDGEKAALALRDYIHKNLALDTFFDAIDIAAGFRFENQIDDSIDTAAFINRSKIRKSTITFRKDGGRVLLRFAERLRIHEAVAAGLFINIPMHPGQVIREV